MASTLSQGAVRLNHLHGSSHCFPGVPREYCLRCAVCLFWGPHLRLRPSWQMSTVQDPRKMWLATGSLLPQSGRLSHVISLRLSSGHSGLVLILSTDYAACPPCPSPARWWQTQASELPLQLAVAVSVYSVGFWFFFLPLMLPSEIPKLPTHPPVRRFPTIWKVLLHDSLPRMGLCH